MIKYETNSGLIQPGQTFVAIKGYTVDGHDFIKEAIKNGAVQAIVEHTTEDNIPQQVVPSTKEFIKEVLVNEYAEALEGIKLIGVTGTNGKTTTCYLTYQLLKTLGVNAAYLGTIGFYINDEIIELPNTTPEILTVYKLILDAKAKGAQYLVMEVSSHSLERAQVAGLKFTMGAFTNLTQDHLDFHETMENYLKAKLKLITYLEPNGKMILNADDPASAAFAKLAPAETIGNDGDYQINSFVIEPHATMIHFSYQQKDYEVKTNLTSKFNIYNYLTALGIVNQLGFKIEDIIAKTSEIYPPKGRCETIKVGDAFAVVDFAHTPDAVEKVLDAYHEFKKARIITIVGCGGDRDPKKRPIMGKIATDKSDYVIFTSDNHRTEDPLKILDDIIRDNPANNYEMEVDRGKAIKKGLDMLKTDDLLMLLGKGHENYQIIGHEKIPFDDSEIVKNYSK